jgi:pSer/pThr/pTyr-binding forkhead associated (FHA) protein
MHIINIIIIHRRFPSRVGRHRKPSEGLDVKSKIPSRYLHCAYTYSNKGSYTDLYYYKFEKKSYMYIPENS